MYLISGKTFTLNNVGLKDAGIYTCIVSNLNGNDTKRFHVTVNGKFCFYFNTVDRDRSNRPSTGS